MTKKRPVNPIKGVQAGSVDKMGGGLYQQ